jgi:hypothetical protein
VRDRPVWCESGAVAHHAPRYRRIPTWPVPTDTSGVRSLGATARRIETIAAHAARAGHPDIDPQPRPGGASIRDRATAALEAGGVRWVRLRPAGETEDDLLVEDAAWPRVRAALGAAGYRHVRRLGRGSHVAFHGFDQATGSWSKLDLVTRIDLGRYQERHTDLAARFLAGRQSDGDGGWALAPDDAFWALLLHELFDRAEPSMRRADTLTALAGGLAPDAPADDGIETLLPRGIRRTDVIDMAVAGDVAGLEALGRRMRHRGRSPLVRLRVLRSKLIRRIDRADPPWLRRGLSVAVLGPDGSGKSTLGRTVNAGGPLPTRTVYLGLYGGSSGRGAGQGRVPGVGLIRRLLRMWRGWLAVSWHVRRGRIVLLDRHPVEARMRPAGGRRPSVGRRILGRSLPLPDVLVVLDAAPATLVARKPEHPIETIEAMRAGYLELAARLPATVVDAEGSPGAVANAVTAIAWQRSVEMDVPEAKR